MTEAEALATVSDREADTCMVAGPVLGRLTTEPPRGVIGGRAGGCDTISEPMPLTGVNDAAGMAAATGISAATARDTGAMAFGVVCAAVGVGAGEVVAAAAAVLVEEVGAAALPLTGVLGVLTLSAAGSVAGGAFLAMFLK